MAASPLACQQSIGSRAPKPDLYDQEIEGARRRPPMRVVFNSPKPSLRFQESQILFSGNLFPLVGKPEISIFKGAPLVQGLIREIIIGCRKGAKHVPRINFTGSCRVPYESLLDADTFRRME
jgi:hypothetical protein